GGGEAGISRGLGKGRGGQGGDERERGGAGEQGVAGHRIPPDFSRVCCDTEASAASPAARRPRVIERTVRPDGGGRERSGLAGEEWLPELDSNQRPFD